MAHNIFHNLEIKASKEAIFNAFTQPKHLNNWWTLKSSGTPIFGTVYNLNFTDKYDWYAKVSEVKPNESFYLKIIKADDDWSPTTFGIHLKENDDNATLVEFSHVNWLNNNNHFKHSSFCWALLLNSLKKYLENGIVIPFEKRE